MAIYTVECECCDNNADDPEHVHNIYCYEKSEDLLQELENYFEAKRTRPDEAAKDVANRVMDFLVEVE